MSANGFQSKDEPYIPTEKPEHLISAETKDRLSSQIDSMFAGRPSANDMYQRGILDWNPEDAEAKDYSEFNKSKKQQRKEIGERLNKRISRQLRPSKTDLEQRGIVPPGAFEDPMAVVEQRDLQHSIANLTLTRHIEQRPSPEEITQSRIYQPADPTDIWGHETVRERKDRASGDLKWRYSQRASIQDLIARGILPPEYEQTVAGERDASQAAAAAGRRSRIAKEKLSMRFSNRVEREHVLARGIVDEQYLYQDVGDVVIKKRNSKLQAQANLASVLGKLKGLQQRAQDGGEESVAASLNPPTSEEKFKRASVDLEWRVKERQELEDIIARGIVHPAFEGVIRGEKTPADAQTEMQLEAHRTKERLERRVNDRMMPDEAVARGVVTEDELEKDYDTVARKQKKDRRALEGKLARDFAARPHKSALEERGITYPKNIAPLPSPSPAPSMSASPLPSPSPQPMQIRGNGIATNAKLQKDRLLAKLNAVDAGMDSISDQLDDLGGVDDRLDTTIQDIEQHLMDMRVELGESIRRKAKKPRVRRQQQPKQDQVNQEMQKELAALRGRIRDLEGANRLLTEQIEEHNAVGTTPQFPTPGGDDEDDLIESGVTTTGGNDLEDIIQNLQSELQNSVESKIRLLESTSIEISRLNRIIMVLLRTNGGNLNRDAVERLLNS